MENRNISWEAEVVLRTLTQKGKKATVLERETGLDKKELREAVRELRLNHYKVCSGNDGYWLWDGTDDSWNHTKAQIKSRMYSMMELYSAMSNEPIEAQVEWAI